MALPQVDVNPENGLKPVLGGMTVPGENCGSSNPDHCDLKFTGYTRQVTIRVSDRSTGDYVSGLGYQTIYYKLASTNMTIEAVNDLPICNF